MGLRSDPTRSDGNPGTAQFTGDLLNNHFPFKSLLRAIVLLPWIVPTVLSALALWWIYDPQFSIISCWWTYCTSAPPISTSLAAPGRRAAR